MTARPRKLCRRETSACWLGRGSGIDREGKR